MTSQTLIQKYIQDKDGNRVLPITSTKAVRDSEGTTVETLIDNIENKLDNTYTKQETYNKEQLNSLITTPNQKYVTAEATSSTTSVTDLFGTTGTSDTVYRAAKWDGSAYNANVYSEYAYDGSSFVLLSTKNVGIDTEVIAGSNNLVTGGGISDTTRIISLATDMLETDFAFSNRGLFIANGIIQEISSINEIMISDTFLLKKGAVVKITGISASSNGIYGIYISTSKDSITSTDYAGTLTGVGDKFKNVNMTTTSYTAEEDCYIVLQTTILNHRREETKNYTAVVVYPERLVALNSATISKFEKTDLDIESINNTLNGNKKVFTSELKQSIWISTDTIPSGTSIILTLDVDSAGDGVTILAKNNDDGQYFVLVSDTVFKLGKSVQITLSQDINRLKLNTKNSSSATTFSKQVTLTLTKGIVKIVEENNVLINNFQENVGNSLNNVFLSRSNVIATIIDDDTASVSAIQNWKNICDQNGIKGTFACITDYLISIEGLKDTLLSYQNEGFHICSHTTAHARNLWKFSEMTSLDINANIQDLQKSRVALNNNGFLDYNYIVYPWSLQDNKSYAETIYKEVCKYFHAGVVTKGGYFDYFNTKDNNNTPTLTRMQIYDNTTINSIKTYVNSCVSNNSWIILFTHSNDTHFDASLMDESIKYVKSLDIPFVTLNEGFKIKYPYYLLK